MCAADFIIQYYQELSPWCKHNESDSNLISINSATKLKIVILALNDTNDAQFSNEYAWDNEYELTFTEV